MGEIADILRERDAKAGRQENQQRKDAEHPDVYVYVTEEQKQIATERRQQVQSKQNITPSDFILPVCSILVLIVVLTLFIKRKRTKQTKESPKKELDTMKRILKIFLSILLAVDIIAFLILLVNSQFIVGYDHVTGMVTDGFGRTLYPAPPLLQMAYIYDWPGPQWYAVDWICSVILLYIAGILLHFITKKKEK